MKSVTRRNNKKYHSSPARKKNYTEHIKSRQFNSPFWLQVYCYSSTIAGCIRINEINLPLSDFSQFMFKNNTGNNRQAWSTGTAASPQVCNLTIVLHGHIVACGWSSFFLSSRLTKTASTTRKAYDTCCKFCLYAQSDLSLCSLLKLGTLGVELLLAFLK